MPLTHPPPYSVHRHNDTGRRYVVLAVADDCQHEYRHPLVICRQVGFDSRTYAVPLAWWHDQTHPVGVQEANDILAGVSYVAPEITSDAVEAPPVAPLRAYVAMPQIPGVPYPRVAGEFQKGSGV